MKIDSGELVRLIAERLDAQAESLAAQWGASRGQIEARHFVLDDVLPSQLAAEIANAFPSDGAGFHQLDSFRERKRTLAKLSQTDPVLNAISIAFQDSRVVGSVARITGFAALEGDRSFYAGGLSMMMPGDFLNPHIDNSHDGSRTRYRRINILYYVNPDWSLEEGGNLELWDRRVKENATIVSGFNRLVVMETHRTSWHSVSQVRGNRPRKCVSNYYFSKASPDGSEYFHVTSFTGRPGETVKRVLGPMDNWSRHLVLKVFRGWVPGKDRADNPDADDRN